MERQAKVIVIKANKNLGERPAQTKDGKLIVAAYCRVSTNSD